MLPANLETILRRFESPDEVRDLRRMVGDQPYLSLHLLDANRYAR